MPRVSVPVVHVRAVHAPVHPVRVGHHVPPALAAHAPVLRVQARRAQAALRHVRAVQSLPSWPVPLRQQPPHRQVAAAVGVARVAAPVVPVAVAAVRMRQVVPSAAVAAASAASLSARSAKSWSSNKPR